jgi:serine/threonine protein kinase
MNLCSRCSGELPAFAVFCPHCAQAHEPNFDELIDLTIEGRYRIYRRLGQGGLSTIFAATDLEIDSVVAIKISNPAQLVLRAMNYAMDADRARDYWDEMLERMRREAETLATITHPNIVRYDGTGAINDDLRYVVMEFLRGYTLRDEMDRNGAFEPSKAVNVAIEVASALIEVHARDIVHRDINPRNIMIADCPISDSGATESCDLQSAIEESAIIHKQGPQSAIKLIDFGIAKFPQPPGAPPFTQHSTLAGTVAYASPEQCAGRQVDNRSDVYSLGVVVYEMVTGRRPFTGRTPTEVALKQIQAEPEPPRSINPAISSSLERAILRALAKNPDDRQQSAEAFSEELRTASRQIFIPLASATTEAEDQYGGGDEISLFADHGEIGETDESNLRLVRRRRRRFAVAAAALTVVITAALYGWNSNSSKRNAGPAAVNAVVAASPSPESITAAGSAADSMELAARAQSQNNNAGVALTPGVQAAPDSTQQTPVANSATPNNQAAAQTSILPAIAAVPAPIPPGTRPQMPPTPSLDIALKRPTQPASQPDLSQGPAKEPLGDGRPRENDSATGDSNPDQGGDVDREPDRSYEYNPPRRRNNDTLNRRRTPDSQNRDDERQNGADDSDTVRPRLYQWSGRVEYQREITIELPGVPGTVEIPRAFRHRVGVIEPPSAANRWNFVVLRIFGRGGVSFVIRWWPAARNAVKLTAWR